MRSNSLFFLSVSDFSDEPITVEVPANQQKIEIQQFFTIVDDNIDEDEQSFVIVAEIGPDVPDNVSCFQLGVGRIECFGRQGATEIRIIDNNRKLFYLCVMIIYLTLFLVSKCKHESFNNDFNDIASFT